MLTNDNETRTGILRRVTLGGIEVLNTSISERDRNVIGMDLLSRFKVTIDTSGSHLFVVKGLAFDRVDFPDMSGLHILKLDGNVSVDSVDDDSPAIAAGLQRGDVINVVNGEPADKVPLAKIRRLLRSKDGQRINLIVSRSGQETPIEFRLKYGFCDTRHQLQEPTDK